MEEVDSDEKWNKERSLAASNYIQSDFKISILTPSEQYLVKFLF
jgi:hypothetical protein